MNDVRLGLGGYKPRDGPLPELGLTLHDLGELIRRAGRDAGFVVETEYCAGCGKIDWVWLSAEAPGTLVVAFEIEGQDVNSGSVRADVDKFRACGAMLNVIALFQVNHNRISKQRAGGGGRPPCERVRGLVEGFKPLEVRLDEELMSPGGIERLQRRAKDQHAATQRA